MPTLLWDACGLTKRYVPEAGRDTVTALFRNVRPEQMVVTFLGYAEVHAILVRRHNQGLFDDAAYLAAVSALETEVIDDPDFGVLEIESAAILAGIALIQKHNLNSADAAIPVALLRYEQLEAASGVVCVLIAADK